MVTDLLNKHFLIKHSPAIEGELIWEVRFKLGPSLFPPKYTWAYETTFLKPLS